MVSAHPMRQLGGTMPKHAVRGRPRRSSRRLRWWQLWQRARQRRARRRRGQAGEEKVAQLLDAFARRRGIRARHSVPLVSRRRRGDLDHALVVGRGPRIIIALETKAERPRPAHLRQVQVNAERAARRHFRSAPRYCVVVHPNSNEPVTYDVATRAARMGLPSLPGYLDELLAGEHPDRMAR
jgi:hypothetical protein